MHNPGYFGDAGGPISGLGSVPRAPSLGQQAPSQFNDERIMSQSLASMAMQSESSIEPARTRDTSPIEVALNENSARISRMGKVVEVLSDRLAPVLRQDLAQGTNADDKAPTPACKLGQDIEAQGRRLQLLIDQIDGIANRLCI